MRKLSDVFRDEFFKELKNSTSNREAYDKVEGRYKDKGLKVYGSYDSFRISSRKKRS